MLPRFIFYGPYLLVLTSNTRCIWTTGISFIQFLTKCLHENYWTSNVKITYGNQPRMTMVSMGTTMIYKKITSSRPSDEWLISGRNFITQSLRLAKLTLNIQQFINLNSYTKYQSQKNSWQVKMQLKSIQSQKITFHDCTNNLMWITNKICKHVLFVLK